MLYVTCQEIVRWFDIVRVSRKKAQQPSCSEKKKKPRALKHIGLRQARTDVRLRNI